MQALIQRVITWGEAAPDIGGMIVVGSQARSDHAADEWSDLDLVIIAADPQPYAASSEWLAPFGDVWFTFVEPAPGGLVERRVLFAGARDVDVILAGRDQVAQMAAEGIPPDLAGLFQRSARVILDKDGLAQRLIACVPPAPGIPQPPSEAEFQQTVHDFWFHTAWTAKKLARGELWMAKMCCDMYMKGLLLRMIEWHARARHGWDYDTWHNGRFLDTWADPAVVERLRDAFAPYDADSVRGALLATGDLFGDLAAEVAARLDYAYPAAASQQVIAWITGGTA